MRIRLGIPMKLSDIAGCIDGKLYSQDKQITHITTDTRDICSGDLFWAIGNGCNFLVDAHNNGAYTLASSGKANIITTHEEAALLKLAESYVKKLPYILYSIGITGSVGKTTTKEFLKIILSERYKVHANAGNYNSQIGLPLSILSAPMETQILIMEMGMNHKGEIKRLAKCLNPDIGIITNIGTAHIGMLGSRDAIAEAKLEILEGSKECQLFIPYDEPLLKKGLGEMTVSISNLNSDYTIMRHEEWISLFSHSENICTASFSLLEDHYLNDLSFALSIGAYLGLTTGELEAGVPRISSNNTRQSVILKGNYQFVADYYNASYESVIALIHTAEHEKNHPKKSLVIGDVLELGEHTEQIHINVGEAIGGSGFSSVFLFGRHMKHVERGIKNVKSQSAKTYINLDLNRPDITANQIKENCSTEELIYMKASRGVMLERILEYF